MRIYLICTHYLHAAMAELADALDLGSSGVTRAGSIPVSRTKVIEISLKK